MSKQTNNEIREKLASIEHERWADWQKYMHSKGYLDSEGNLTLTCDYIKHWERQIATPYSELSEVEKESDRKQVERYWPLIQGLLEEQAQSNLKAKVMACVPEVMNERNMAKLAEDYTATTVGEVQLWNACRSQLLSNLKDLI